MVGVRACAARRGAARRADADMRGARLCALACACAQALVVPQEKFQHILRILNTNVSGTQKVAYALTKIRGVGKRFANMVCKKANIDMKKR
jgi:hypothetical protein